MPDDEKMEATESAEDLTATEESAVEETNETPAEAHRAGEFVELRDLLQQVLSDLAELKSSVGAYKAVAIDNGSEPDDVIEVDVADGEDLKDIAEPESDRDFFDREFENKE